MLRRSRARLREVVIAVEGGVARNVRVLRGVPVEPGPAKERKGRRGAKLPLPTVVRSVVAGVVVVVLVADGVVLLGSDL